MYMWAHVANVRHFYGFLKFFWYPGNVANIRLPFLGGRINQATGGECWIQQNQQCRIIMTDILGVAIFHPIHTERERERVQPAHSGC